MADQRPPVAESLAKDMNSGISSLNTIYPLQAVLACVLDLGHSAASVKLPDGKRASLPWKEVWPLFKIHDDYRDFCVVEVHVEGQQVVQALKDAEAETINPGRSIAVGDWLYVIPVDIDFGMGKRAIVSHVLVDRDPWDDVAIWPEKAVKTFTVESVTDLLAWGTISPGVRARVSLEGLKEILPVRNWPGHQIPLQGDEIAGWFLPKKTDQKNRIVTLDFVGYLKSQLSLDGLFNLPTSEISATRNALTEPSETPSPSFPHARIQTMLILDDDEEFCESLKSHLRDSCGVEALAFFDARSALESFQERGADIDLAIVDVNLQPGKGTGKDHTGIMFAQQIQRIISDCPIVLTTGEQLDIENEDITNAFDLLVNDIVPKPFGMDSLHRSLAAPGRTKKPIAEILGRSILRGVDRIPTPAESDIGSALEDLKESISAEAVVLFSINPISDEVAIIRVAGSHSKYHSNKTKLGWSPIRDAAIKGELVFTPNATDKRDIPKHRYLQRAYLYRSCIGVGVNVGLASYYAYSLFVFHPGENHFKDSALRLVRRTAREIGQYLRIGKLEEDIREMNPFEIIGQSYGSMAHDLRRDLSSAFLLDNAITQISSGETNAAKIIIEKAKARLYRVNQIVEGISALTSGRYEEVRTFNALEELMRITNRLKAEVGKDGVSLALVDKLQGIPCLKMRPSRLDQLVTNLVINAAQQLERLSREKVLTRNGEVRIKVMEKIDHVGSPWLVIQIYDNGPGIHKRDFERVFDLFYTTKEHGCGMGLDICRKIAREVNIGENEGKVIVRRSLFLCGSCFEIRLPISL